MKKKYIDYAGLKRVLKHLLPPIDAKPTCHDVDSNLVKGQKIVELTREQFDALAIKDPDTYYMINDDNEPRAWYQHPDWDNGEYISNPGNRTYTVPKSGIVYVADAISNATNHIATLSINGHVVATMGTEVSYASSGSFPVDTGDVVQTIDLGSRSRTVLGFVPWKTY